MKRVVTPPRIDWQEQVEALGLSYHTTEDGLYWDESAYYVFNSYEIEKLETASQELQRICVEGAELAIRENWRERLHISETAWQEVIASWERDDISLYGRFDLMWNGHGEPKLLEYNADTPTGLLEAAVVQWQWLEQRFPHRDQFNSLHESLVESWKAWPHDLVSFTALEQTEEDWRNLLYLEDTAVQAGKTTQNLGLGSVGWSSSLQRFVDESDRPLDCLFKLYPWEWMWQENFAQHLVGQCQHFLEPVWKMLWSNKAFLVLLWEKFPYHPNLLAAYFTSDRLGGDFVAKPIFGREGANVQVTRGGQPMETSQGPWGNQPLIYQKLANIAEFDGQHPVIGSWVIGGEACGIGIREDRNNITANASRFVPHLF
jgi:glutathionylspermidine synthase